MLSRVKVRRAAREVFMVGLRWVFSHWISVVLLIRTRCLPLSLYTPNLFLECELPERGNVGYLS